MKAKIYTTKTCAYCPMVKKYLDSKGVDFVELDASDPQIGQEAMRISGALTVPITVINEQIVVGWNPAKLAQAIGG